MARTSKPAPAAPEPSPKVVVNPEPMPLIGPACPPFTSGWLMGIGSRPETPAEHAARLGASAGEFNDIGWSLGTLEARPAWPTLPDGSVVPPATQLIVTDAGDHVVTDTGYLVPWQ